MPVRGEGAVRDAGSLMSLGFVRAGVFTVDTLLLLYHSNDNSVSTFHPVLRVYR